MFSSFSREGRGVHTGRCAKVRVEMGDAGSGIVFVRHNREILARPENIASSSKRATSLECDGQVVGTVEHLLSALAMVGERDVRITLEGGDEIPILDGCACLWMKAFLEHGADEKIAFVELCHEIEVRRGDSFGRMIPAMPGDSPAYSVHLEFEDYGRGSQDFRFRPGVDSFLDAVAPARTFAFLEDIRDLWARGLARGGDLDCALVLGKQGAVNPDGERFENEPARHKMLDAIGDLSLLGGLPFAKITLEKPGHRLLHDLVIAAWRQLGPSKGEVL